MSIKARARCGLWRLQMEDPKKPPPPARRFLIPLDQGGELSTRIQNTQPFLPLNRLAYLPQPFLLSQSQTRYPPVFPGDPPQMAQGGRDRNKRRFLL